MNEADLIACRRELMRACAHASESDMDAAIASAAYNGKIEIIRAPEYGLVMLRGRVGGTGTAFNVGEASATRAAVQLSDGTRGVSYLLGRSSRRARLAAILDGLVQLSEFRDGIMSGFAEPVLRRLAETNRRKAEEAAATRVDFFTLVRGEDA